MDMDPSNTVLHKAQQSQGFNCFGGRTFPGTYWLACLPHDGRVVWLCPAIQVCRSSIVHLYDHLMSAFQCALRNGRNFWVLYLTDTEFPHSSFWPVAVVYLQKKTHHRLDFPTPLCDIGKIILVTLLLPSFLNFLQVQPSLVATLFTWSCSCDRLFLSRLMNCMTGSQPPLLLLLFPTLVINLY